MELFITCRTVVGDEGIRRQFQYYLVIDQIDTGSFLCENYGVRVCEDGVASVRIPGLTTSAVRIDQLMTLLVDNAVGPVGLGDVVRDWL